MTKTPTESKARADDERNIYLRAGKIIEAEIQRRDDLVSVAEVMKEVGDLWTLRRDLKAETDRLTTDRENAERELQKTKDLNQSEQNDHATKLGAMKTAASNEVTAAKEKVAELKAEITRLEEVKSDKSRAAGEADQQLRRTREEISKLASKMGAV